MLLVFSQSVALDPEFSKKRTKMYVTGGTKVCCCSVCLFFVLLRNNSMTFSDLMIKKSLTLKIETLWQAWLVTMVTLDSHYGNLCKTILTRLPWIYVMQ